MIARSWRGVTAANDADEYLEYLRQTALPDYRATPGNRGVLVMRRRVGDRCEFVLLSFWESLDAVRAYAGNDADVAKYYAEDKRYLLEMEPVVRHYELPEGLPGGWLDAIPSRL